MSESGSKGGVRVKAAATGRVLLKLEGRGRLGKTTEADMLIQRAKRQGRKVIPFDADVETPALAAMYAEEAWKPKAPGQVAFGEAINLLLAGLSKAQGQVGAVIDMPGGQADKVAAHNLELSLPRFCERHGILAVSGYAIGPDMQDWEHVLALRENDPFERHARDKGGVAPAILFFNEAIVPRGVVPLTAFGPIIETEAYKTWRERGAKVVFVPRLACLERLRSRGVTLLDAIAGDKPGVDVTDSFMVEDWLDQIEASLQKSGATEWLP